MRLGDLVSLSWGALQAHRLRTRLTAVALAIGIGAVLLLTGLGEGARRWIELQFASLGSTALVVLPGRTETRGGPPLVATTTHDLTLQDADAIARRLPRVRRVVPVAVGEATASFEGRRRATSLVGSTQDFLTIRQVDVVMGEGLPKGDVFSHARVCVVGRTIQRELFGGKNPLGARLKLGDFSFLVIGVIAQRGQSMMVNVDDMVLIPVGSALKLLNRSGLFRVIVEVPSVAELQSTSNALTTILRDRHDGEEDFTVLTPGALAASIQKIIAMLTLALASIAAISLTVAGIGVMNVMVISVTERSGEVGILKAIGASNAQVLGLFLTEAIVLSVTGGVFGLTLGVALTRLAVWLYPAVPTQVPLWAIGLGASVPVVVGIVFGLLPALRAARLQPLDALRRTL